MPIGVEVIDFYLRFKQITRLFHISHFPQSISRTDHQHVTEYISAGHEPKSSRSVGFAIQ